VVLVAMSIGSALRANAQSRDVQASGPVIQSTGRSFVVENPTFRAPAGHVFKMLYEINAGGDDTTKMNAQLTTMARFYNIHARNGYPLANLKAAAVVHDGGWGTILNDSAYAARFGGARNPSRKLVEELVAAGAQIILCGQTAGSRNIARSDLIPGVLVATSAMTALSVLGADGYRLVPW
jgi:intracellular sulfur oxidation DsrE/DsrF family protein